MRIDRRLTVVLGVSLVWALIVTAIFTRVTSGGKATRVTGPEKPLIVATRALPLGSMLTRDAVKLRSIPQSLFPTGGFSKVEDVMDRPVISPIQADEPVLEARIATRGSGVGLAPMIPAGMRAISVRVNDVVGVAGFVLPGMRVDVLVTGKPSDHPDTVTRTVLQNIVVLSAGQTIQSDGKNAISTPVVTLLVTPEDAESLTLANNDGHIQLVLRNSADDVLANPRGRQLSDLYAARGKVAAPPVSAVPVGDGRTARRSAVRGDTARAGRGGGVGGTADTVKSAPAVMAPTLEQVTVIRGNVKTVEATQAGAEK
jgi:pilus assembly protein CpaB